MKTCLGMLLSCAAAGLLLAPFSGHAQQSSEQLAARCAQLGGLFDRFNLQRGEGSGGPNMARLGAALDCQRGRYQQGIKALEELLQRNRIPYPPAG
jgi:hypothetical protein